jgi:DNA-directed RNA polymerase subunit RPC12/RpoP
LEEIRCRICDSALFVASSLDERPSREGLPVRSEVQIETDGTSQYFKCPYCSARNITIVTTAQNGRSGMQVAWAVMNGD